jgi:cytochrome c oxidase subunit 3
MLHVVGGVIARIVVVVRAFWVKTSETGVVPVQIVATYWHFVDILWIYLFIFYHMIA